MAESPLESITRREALGRLGKVGLGLTGLALASVPAVAQAFDWTIEELYERSEPAYHVMPGMRVKQDKPSDTIRGDGTGFKGTWPQYYFDDPEYSPKLQDIFRQLDRQVMSHRGTHFTFSFERFHKFMEDTRESMDTVTFYDSGFINVYVPKERTNYILPVPKDVVKIITNL